MGIGGEHEEPRPARGRPGTPRDRPFAHAGPDAHAAFVAAVRASLRDSGTTQAELARRVGVSPEQLSRWLARGANPNLHSLAEALEAAGLRIDFRPSGPDRPSETGRGESPVD